MQKTNFLRTARTAVSAIFVSATFTMAGASTPAQAQNSLTIATDWAPYGVHGPLFLAAQNGWFKDAGRRQRTDALQRVPKTIVGDVAKEFSGPARYFWTLAHPRRSLADLNPSKL